MLTWESTGLEEKEEARKWGSGLEQSGWEHLMTSSYIRDLSCKLSCQKKLCASWSQCNRLTEQSSWTSRSTTRATMLLRPGLCALVSWFSLCPEQISNPAASPVHCTASLSTYCSLVPDCSCSVGCGTAGFC